MARGKRYFLDKPANVTALWRVFVAVCAALLLVDLLYQPAGVLRSLRFHWYCLADHDRETAAAAVGAQRELLR
jgi:hypothetical protein